VARRDVSGGEQRDALEIRCEPHDARIDTVDARRRHAVRLFAPLGPTYDRMGALLSFGQDPRWRRFLVTRLPRDGGAVLDVATGTGLVAGELVRRGFRVTALDQSPEMLAVARRRLGAQARVVEASAEALPFPDEAFDHLTFTYLLRYVDDPAAVLRELARVVRPGGTIASLEFSIPPQPWRVAWSLYVDVGLPLLGRTVSPGWHAVGRFLGPSIRAYCERWPAERQLALWRDTGIEQTRLRPLSLGGAVVVWGRRA
jgi:demethylmenaquinone methyltransferase/2-methoxy-6-polyprenyl-1,4-benzoquinol methylase